MPETNPNSPDSPFNDSPFNDSPFNDSPFNDSPFNDSFVTLSISHSGQPVPFSDSYDISCANFKGMILSMFRIT